MLQDRGAADAAIAVVTVYCLGTFVLNVVELATNFGSRPSPIAWNLPGLAIWTVAVVVGVLAVRARERTSRRDGSAWPRRPSARLEIASGRILCVLGCLGLTMLILPAMIFLPQNEFTVMVSVGMGLVILAGFGGGDGHVGTSIGLGIPFAVALASAIQIRFGIMLIRDARRRRIAEAVDREWRRDR